ncbi:MAG: hypothetical protein PHS14_07350 [Elusimicrobia bacterium]|nr:hypothetical protein [Elusimicrobiota bacterium]
MKAFNAALRALFALLFCAAALLALWLLAAAVRDGGEAAGVKALAGCALTAGLAAWLAYMFGASAREVAAGRKAPVSTAAMAAAALALGLFFHTAYVEVLGPLSRIGYRGMRSELGTMRTALSIYYGDTEGHYPADLSIMVGTKWAPYAKELPEAVTGRHPKSRAVLLMSGEDFAARRFTDAGGWAYAVGGDTGAVTVNCTHADAAGKVFSTY